MTNQDWGAAQSKSHDLKGMGGAMGYPGITELSGSLNTRIKKKEYPEAALLCKELGLLCDDILKQHGT